MFHKIFKIFDKSEDKVRSFLSRKPILYATIGGIFIVLFWRGIWLTADMFPFMNGPFSVLISVIVLLITGLFVSFFIGDRLLLSGLKYEKKLAEKTEAEIKTEMDVLNEIKAKIEKIEKDVEIIKNERTDK